MQKHMNFFIREAFHLGSKTMPSKFIMFGRGKRFIENKQYLQPQFQPLRNTIDECRILLNSFGISTK